MHLRRRALGYNQLSVALEHMGMPHRQLLQAEGLRIMPKCADMALRGREIGGIQGRGKLLSTSGWVEFLVIHDSCRGRIGRYPVSEVAAVYGAENYLQPRPMKPLPKQSSSSCKSLDGTPNQAPGYTGH
jgi:hypothetical protein